MSGYGTISPLLHLHLRQCTPHALEHKYLDQLMPVVDCVQISTGVQSTDTAADLRKVTAVFASPNLERTPSVVGGRVERFGDIGKMIGQLEML